MAYYFAANTVGVSCHSDEREDPFSPEDRRKVSDLGTQIDLLLNRDEPAQAELWQIAQNIHDAETIAERHALDGVLVAKARIVMKTEWERIKKELRNS